MKIALSVLLCCIASYGFSQTTETFTQEKSSAWIKVVADPVAPPKPEVVKKETTTTKKSTTNKPVQPRSNNQQEFEKTNSQVNRFKKQKKG